MVKNYLHKYWFTFALLVSFILPFADISGVSAKAGVFLSNNHGPDLTIILIFLCSGLVLESGEIRSGLKDILPLFSSLILIFIFSPIIAFFIIKVISSKAIIAGIAIVASMPTTLSSGVVMTSITGGNKAQALLITIISNSMALFTIPITLAFLLGKEDLDYKFFKFSDLVLKIGLKVLLPLFIGYLIVLSLKKITTFQKQIQFISQILILIIVWISSSAAKGGFSFNSFDLFIIILYVFLFHFLLSFVACLMVILLKIEKGRREAVIFMGAQKTLPLSIIIQVTLFPNLVLVLVVCVMHHLVQLIYDSFLQALMTDKVSETL